MFDIRTRSSRDEQPALGLSPSSSRVYYCSVNYVLALVTGQWVRWLAEWVSWLQKRVIQLKVFGKVISCGSASIHEYGVYNQQPINIFCSVDMYRPFTLRWWWFWSNLNPLSLHCLSFWLFDAQTWMVVSGLQHSGRSEIPVEHLLWKVWLLVLGDSFEQLQSQPWGVQTQWRLCSSPSFCFSVLEALKFSTLSHGVRHYQVGKPRVKASLPISVQVLLRSHSDTIKWLLWTVRQVTLKIQYKWLWTQKNHTQIQLPGNCCGLGNELYFRW